MPTISMNNLGFQRVTQLFGRSKLVPILICIACSMSKKKANTLGIRKLPWVVQHPSRVTILACWLRCCMIESSLNKSLFSLGPAPSFTPLTATRTVRPPSSSQSQRFLASAFHTWQEELLLLSSFLAHRLLLGSLAPAQKKRF